MNRYIKVCSCCGEELSLFFMDYKNYTYKIALPDKKLIYQCSYQCHQKEKINRAKHTRNAGVGRSTESNKVQAESEEVWRECS